MTIGTSTATEDQDEDEGESDTGDNQNTLGCVPQVRQGYSRDMKAK